MHIYTYGTVPAHRCLTAVGTKYSTEKSINIVIGQTFLIYLLFGGITLPALSTDNYILSVYNRMPVIQFIYFFLLFQFSLILLKTFKNLCVLLDDGWLEKKNSLAMTLC
jgi:hypothetical protein